MRAIIAVKKFLITWKIYYPKQKLYVVDILSIYLKNNNNKYFVLLHIIFTDISHVIYW